MFSSRASKSGFFAAVISIVVIYTAQIGIASAGEVVTVTSNDFERIKLVNYLDVLEDPGRAFSLDDVIAAPVDSAFIAATRRDSNIGFTSSAYWLRFSVEFADGVDESAILELDAPLADHFELFIPNGRGGYQQVVEGDSQPFHSRRIDHRNFSFDVGNWPGESRTLYARVVGDTSAIELPLSLVSRQQFISNALRTNYLFGVYYGVILLLAAVSIFSYVLFKSCSCGWHAAYLLTFLLFQMSINGFGYQLLWPHSTVLQAQLPTLLAGLSLIFAVIFAQQFLKTATRNLSIEWLLRAIVLVITGGVVYHFIGTHNYGTRVVVTCAALVPIIIFALAARALQSGYRPARYFLLGWALFLVGVMTTGLHMLAVGPNIPGAAYAMQIGSVFQIIFISLSLGHHITDSRREKDARIRDAQKQLLALNESLEQQVHSRTIELETRSQELTELAVRDGLTGLYNHSTAIELLKQLVAHGKRYEFPTAVMMLDIDRFKSVNDAFGHPVGDKALLAVSKTLVDELRSADVVGRYGGDEFLIVLSHAGVASAREYGERLLQRIRGIDLPELGAHQLTASLGISILNTRIENLTAGKLIQRADQAMYRSKMDGRDRLTISNLSVVVANDN